MKFISEDGNVYKSKKDYWLTMYPMKKNEPLNINMIRRKRIPDCNYVGSNQLFVKNYLKNKYTNDEQSHQLAGIS